jgi:large subunit ribosomal protein L28
MAKVCQITGKKVMVGNNVSHANNRTRRTFKPNLFTKKFYVPSEDAWVDLKVSASGLRIIDKLGIEGAIEYARKKGLIA